MNITQQSRKFHSIEGLIIDDKCLYGQSNGSSCRTFQCGPLKMSVIVYYIKKRKISMLQEEESDKRLHWNLELTE